MPPVLLILLYKMGENLLQHSRRTFRISGLFLRFKINPRGAKAVGIPRLPFCMSILSQWIPKGEKGGTYPNYP